MIFPETIRFFQTLKKHNLNVKLNFQPSYKERGLFKEGALEGFNNAALIRAELIFEQLIFADFV